MPLLDILSRIGWTATGSSTWDSNYISAYVLDGNTSSDWHSSSSAVYPHHVILDLGSPKTFNMFRFRPRNDPRNPLNSELYVSDDGISWGSPIATASGWDGTATIRDITFSTVTKRYVKFVGLAPATGAGNYMGASELYLGLYYDPIYRPSMVNVPVIRDTRLRENNVLVRCASSVIPCGSGGGSGDTTNYGFVGSSITENIPPPLPPSTYPEAVMATEGLIAYYRLEETEGTIAYDTKGISDGTFVNPANMTLGTTSLSGLDKCYTFNGINSYILLPQLVGAGDYSIECWFKTTAIPPGGIDNPLAPAEQGFGLVQSTNGGDDDWGLALSRSAGKTLVTAQCGSTYTGSFFGMTSNPAVDLSDGQWHYVLLTHVRSSGLSRLYVDGVLHEEDTLDNGPQDATGSIRIGSIQFGNRGFFNGQIDEVAIYNVAITEADMLAHLATLPWP